MFGKPKSAGGQSITTGGGGGGNGRNYAASMQSSRVAYAPPRQVYVNIPLPSDQLDPRSFAQGYYRPKSTYSANRIRTSKYTLLTFLPKNLFEQFRRVANSFFLGLVLLQTFPEYMTVPVIFAAAPIIFIVAATAIKDGFEDYRRWRQDKMVNNRPALILGDNGWRNYNYPDRASRTVLENLVARIRKWIDAPSLEEQQRYQQKHIDQPPKSPQDPNVPVANCTSDEKSSEPSTQQHKPQSPNPTILSFSSSNQYKWSETTWQSLKVGDIIYLQNNDPIPADIVIVSTSEPDSMCYIETKNLDGETNLKLRQGPIETAGIQTPTDCAKRFKLIVDSEPPTINMLRYQATMSIFGESTKMTESNSIEISSSKPSVTDSMYKGASSSGSAEIASSKKIPIDINGILLRGAVLRNTKWVIGIVIFTGEDTKQIMNSGKTPSKRSQMEKFMNIHIVFNLIFMIILCIVVSIGYTRWYDWSFDTNAPFVFGFQRADTGYEGFISFWACLLLFQNIVPISLYISIELVKLGQALFIHWDLDLYYEVNDTPVSARSWNLSDNLGQIDYIFSDKTGTLTRNIMEFKKCAINGVVYDGKMKTGSSGLLSPSRFSRASMSARSLFSFKAAWLEGNHETVASRMHGHSRNASSSSPPVSPEARSRNSVHGSLNGNENDKTDENNEETMPSGWYDEALMNYLENPAMMNTTQGIIIRDFFTLLSICHTVLVDEKVEKEVTNRENSEDAVVETTISYKAQSPDEACLVTLAAETGFIFKGRFYNNETMQNEIVVEILGKEEKFALLNVLEFDSDRKRMSVIVRPLSGGPANSKDVILFCKGADSIIYERLLPGQSDMMEKTNKMLEVFGEEGLRTLCLAYRKIPGDVYEKWSQRYFEAISIIYPDPSFRTKALESLNNEVERDLFLLGATAIEDKLQDGVPDCIRTLSAAGIKIWVLTGDKVETAINIGFLCGLLKSGEDTSIDDLVLDDSEMILIQLKNAKDSFDMHRQMLLALERFWGIIVSPGGKQITTVPVSSRRARKEYALIIDGISLKYALENDEMKRTLLDLACRCKSVICCRVSPLQKAKVVEMVKTGKKVLTLAIGDGANDVSMIQAADVGVGISGEEGLQAAMSADYAIAQFRFLSKLLLVHGRWSYSRMSYMILNFYLKSIVITLVLFWFQFYAGFTSAVAYEFTYLLFFNLFFTSLPIMFLGLFDQDVNDQLCLKMPQIYGSEGIPQTFYTHRLFFLYVLDAIWFSLSCFFVPIGIYNESSNNYDGKNFDMLQSGTLMATSAIIASNLSVAVDSHSWTWMNHLVYWGSCSLIIIYILVYSIIPRSAIYGIFAEILNDWTFYFGLVLCLLISLGPRIVIYYARRVFKPTDSNILQEIQALVGTGKATIDELSKSPSIKRRGTSSSVSAAASKPSSLYRKASNASFHSVAFSMETGDITTPTGFSFSHTLGMGNVILRSPLSMIQNQLHRLGTAASTKSKNKRQKSETQSRPTSAPSNPAAVDGAGKINTKSSDIVSQVKFKSLNPSKLRSKATAGDARPSSPASDSEAYQSDANSEVKQLGTIAEQEKSPLDKRPPESPLRIDTMVSMSPRQPKPPPEDQNISISITSPTPVPDSVIDREEDGSSKSDSEKPVKTDLNSNLF